MANRSKSRLNRLYFSAHGTATVWQAAVQVAEATVSQVTNQLALAQALTDSRALSHQEFLNRRDAVALAAAKLAQSRADLEAVQTDLERLIARAPVDG